MKKVTIFSFGIIFHVVQNTLYGKIVFPFPMINGNFAIIFPLWLFLRGLLFYFGRVVLKTMSSPVCSYFRKKDVVQHSCKQTFCKKRRYKIVSLSVFPLWSHYSAFEISSLPAGHQWQEKKNWREFLKTKKGACK